MMAEPHLTRISKLLSYHLRHRPDLLGLTLGPGGAAGHVFFCAANGVWLVDAVPPTFIQAP